MPCSRTQREGRWRVLFSSARRAIIHQRMSSLTQTNMEKDMKRGDEL